MVINMLAVFLVKEAFYDMYMQYPTLLTDIALLSLPQQDMILEPLHWQELVDSAKRFFGDDGIQAADDHITMETLRNKQTYCLWREGNQLFIDALNSPLWELLRRKYPFAMAKEV